MVVEEYHRGDEKVVTAGGEIPSHPPGKSRHTPPGKSRHKGVGFGDGEFTVTWNKWFKFQEDSSTSRTRRWRANVTEQRRGEEKRADIKSTTPLPPSSIRPSRDYPELHIADGQPTPRKDA